MYCFYYSQWIFQEVPFGLNLGSEIMQRLVDSLFSAMKLKYVLPYIDDLWIFSHDFTSHLVHLQGVLTRLRNANLTVNPSKNVLAGTSVKFLGHVLSSQGISVDPQRIAAINQIPPPKNLKQLRALLGMAGFYNTFVPHYSNITEPLNALKRKGAKFIWTEEHQNAFLRLKQSLIHAPILQIPNFSLPFEVSTDASNFATGGVLHQKEGEERLPIANYSHLLSPTERIYSTYERESLVFLLTLEHFSTYLEHREFSIKMDQML